MSKQNKKQLLSSNRNKEIATGLLFFVSTTSYLIGDQLVRASAQASNFIFTTLSPQLAIGLMLQLTNIAAVIGIAILLFLLLKQSSPKLSAGYLTGRLLEGALLFISALGAIIAWDWYGAAFQLAMIVLALGSLLLCIILYKNKHVPRALSVLGLIGYTCLLTSAVLGIFGHQVPILFAPGAIFEIVFPLWLIFKGLENVSARAMSKKVY